MHYIIHIRFNLCKNIKWSFISFSKFTYIFFLSNLLRVKKEGVYRSSFGIQFIIVVYIHWRKETKNRLIQNYQSHEQLPIILRLSLPSPLQVKSLTKWKTQKHKHTWDTRRRCSSSFWSTIQSTINNDLRL